MPRRQRALPRGKSLSGGWLRFPPSATTVQFSIRVRRTTNFGRAREGAGDLHGLSSLCLPNDLDGTFHR